MPKIGWEYMLTESGEGLRRSPLRPEVARVLSQISKSGKATPTSKEDVFIINFLLEEGYIERWSFD